ncbi:hypothetical protein M222_2080 [Enterococcus faecalis AZ19]|nr:hypothetical protein M222_2080 [Enterococcus faecalis AZ19]
MSFLKIKSIPLVVGIFIPLLSKFVMGAININQRFLNNLGKSSIFCKVI